MWVFRPAIYMAFDKWDYLENNDVLRQVSFPVTSTVLKRFNNKTGIHLGIPVKYFFKSTITIEGFNNTDRFVNGDVFISTDTLDVLKLTGFKTGLSFQSNTLNRKQYASSGKAFSLSAFYFRLNEHYVPGNTSVEKSVFDARHQWFRLKATAEQYFTYGRYRPGYYLEGVFSNQSTFKNYNATIINAPAFLPLQDSRTLMLQNFRSFNYIAGGVRNVYALRSKLDARLEGYIFKPLDYLSQNTRQEVKIENELQSFFLAGTAGLVYHAPIGPVSFSVNYYNDKENKLGVLLHVGFLLFNKHSIDQ
jgi:NTE family protein